MIVCSGCERHVRGDSVACPFCGDAVAKPLISPEAASAASRAVQMVGGALTTVVLAACYGGWDMKATGLGTGDTGDSSLTTSQTITDETATIPLTGLTGSTGDTGNKGSTTDDTAIVFTGATADTSVTDDTVDTSTSATSLTGGTGLPASTTPTGGGSGTR